MKLSHSLVVIHNLMNTPQLFELYRRFLTNNQFDLQESALCYGFDKIRHSVRFKVHCPHNQGSQYLKCRLNLVIPIYNLTIAKLDNLFQHNQWLQAVDYIHHGHPIAGILSLCHESNFPIQSKLLVMMFRQTMD